MKLAAMMQVTLMMEMIVLYQSGALNATFLELVFCRDSQFAKVSLQGKLLKKEKLGDLSLARQYSATHHDTDDHGNDGENELASRVLRHVVECNLACKDVGRGQTDTLRMQKLSDA